MEKKDFYDLLDTALKGQPLETVNTTLEAIKFEWLKEYADKKLEGYSYCPECGKYSKKKAFETRERIAERYHTNISNERERYIETLREYICPKCGKVAKEELISWYHLEMWEENELS